MRHSEMTSAQWAAFDQVLNYLNTLEERVVPKKEIYAAVMSMRPAATEHEKMTAAAPELYAAIGAALAAMTIASALPGVAKEYDFEPAIAVATNAYLKAQGLAALNTNQETEA